MDTAVGLDWRRRVKDFEGWDDRIIESILTVEGTRKIWERGVPGTRYLNRKLVINGSLREAGADNGMIRRTKGTRTPS